MLTKYKVAAVQAAPAFLDLEEAVHKSISLIEEAAAEGAKLIAFPECWIPGYPWWIWLDCPINCLHFVQRYHANSLVPDSPEFQKICHAAKRHEIAVILGASERDHGSLYISQFFIGTDGLVFGARRKLKPTHVERTVFGDGYGKNLMVYDTELGKIGGLCCWEHLQPLSKYAMYSEHEQVHVGAWPSFSLYPGKAYSLGAELNLAVSSVYAAEGQCYFIAPCGTISEKMVELLADTPQKRELLRAGGGYSMIFAPDGSPMCNPLPEDQEGLLYADIDLEIISIAKSFADPVGHYSRPDVTRLLLNNTPQVTPVEAVNTLSATQAEVEEQAADDTSEQDGQ